MISTIKHTIMSNLIIKILSLIIGYSVWVFISDRYTIYQTREVPLCFFNQASEQKITATPEFFKGKVAGKKSDLALCTHLECHIDARTLNDGQHFLIAQENNLFLPASVKLLYSSPLKVIVSHE